MTATQRNIAITNFVLQKYWGQKQKSGIAQAARNMRKQGYPIELARAVLLGV